MEGENKKSSNKALVITGLVIAFLIVALVTNGFSLFGNNPSALNLSIGSSPVEGDANAPVTIYEFSDFSCPFCAAAAGYNDQAMNALKSQSTGWQAPLPLIKQNYVDAGEVKIVFKYSQGHGTGKAAHAVGWCLNDQNLFWKFYDLAFANQQDTGDLSKMKNLAGTIGANMAQLQSCLDSGKHNSQFNEDSNMAQENGVKGTPTFFVNGNMVEGAQSYDTFKNLIDKELGKLK